MRVLRSAWVRQSGTGRCFQSSTGQFVGWFVWGYLGATGKEQVACFLHTFKEQLSTVRTCSVSIWYLVPVLGALCLLRLSHTRVHAGARTASASRQGTCTGAGNKTTSNWNLPLEPGLKEGQTHTSHSGKSFERSTFQVQLE